MSHISEDTKKMALDEYLKGDKSIKLVCEKYKISTSTFNLYKNKNEDYVKSFNMPKKKGHNEHQIVKDFLDTEILIDDIKKGKHTNKIYVDTSGDKTKHKHKHKKDDNYGNIINDIQNKNATPKPKPNIQNKNIDTKYINKTKKLKIISYEKEIEDLISNAYKLE